MTRELFKHLLKKPATLRYPFEKRVPFKDVRGRPVWDISKCVGCGICSRVCPARAIEMVGKEMEAEIKHYVDRCIFCAQCVEDCPEEAISMTEEYELAGDDRAGMVIEFKRVKSTKEKSKNERKVRDS